MEKSTEKKLRRLLWAAVYEKGFFRVTNPEEGDHLARGLKLSHAKSKRGQLYRALRAYITPKIQSEDEGDVVRYYIPKELLRAFYPNHPSFRPNLP